MSAAQVDDTAIAWAIREDSGLDAQEELAFEAWLAEDDRHLGAYVRARGFFLRTERAAALGESYRPEDFLPSQSSAPKQTAKQIGEELANPSRRRFVGMAIAASAAGVIGAGTLFYRGAGAERFVTRRGEVRVVALADGSTITLNTNSSVLVEYGAHNRSIKLESGEALFDVAKDALRPFVVRTAAMDVTAVGTSFTVSRVGEAAARVVVAEGIVEARSLLVKEPQALRLEANMAATASRRMQMIATEVPSTEIERELLWREGRIQFENATLQEAALQFSRYSDIAIEIEDPALRTQQISGAYLANDPVGFCRVVAQIFDAKVHVEEGAVHLSR
ncbi:FecR domain-containing protein [Novosphingobium sp. BL-8A]|uniref:FecR family protein n=1 Tax=Novosphingobium sp. BL-8A TaxID=3127639 RepID=UPI0037574F2A